MSTERASTVPAMFVQAVRHHPGRTFLRWIQEGRTWQWSYAEAAARVAALCRVLGESGAATGDRVVIYTAETVPSVLFDLACAHMRLVFAPFDSRSTPALVELCEQVGARIVLTTLDRAAEVREQGLEVLALGRGGELDGDQPAPGRHAAPQARGLDGAGPLAELAHLCADLDGDAPYMLQPTSGTTGRSKLVIRQHRAFARIARLLGADLGLDRATEPAERLLLIQAMTHGFGQYMLSIGLSLAAELCVTSRIDTGASLDEIRALDPTYVGFTPRVVRAVIQQNGGASSERRLLGRSARILLTGGARADDDLLRLFHDQGVQIVEVYGASEFSVVAVTRPGAWEPGWVGPVLPDAELRRAEDGELLARTPAVMPGYFGDAAATRAAFTEDGFYRSGDRVEIDGRGMLRYVARARDMFNLFDGSHVSPTPGEEAMAALPWVEQVVLLGDQRPLVAALVVPGPQLRATGPAMAGALRRQVELDVGRVNSALEPNARIQRVALLGEAMPPAHYQIVANGKVRRVRAAIALAQAAAIEALYGEDTGAGPLPIVLDIPGAAEERRRSTRVRGALPVLVRSGDDVCLGAAIDISRTGLLAESALAPLPGRRLTVEIIEPAGANARADADRSDGASGGQPGPGPAIRLAAEVVRHVPGGFAARFVDREASRELLGRRLPP